MNVKDLSKPLSVDQIDFRIQSINNGKYATILAYKDARADMNRLDEVCGSLNWKREHTRDNANCIISIWDESKKQWVSKEDTGTESMTEKEKGLASDSFKRSGFNWGIGRELYDYPVIQIRLNDDEVMDTGKPKPKYRGSFNLKVNDWDWQTEFLDGKLNRLTAFDKKGVKRYHWANGKAQTDNSVPPTKKKETPKKPAPKTITNENLTKGIKQVQSGDIFVFDLEDKLKGYELTTEQQVLIDELKKNQKNK